MQQSDAMLISSLKQHIPLSEDITTIKDIRTEQIYQISCTIFESLKIDYSELKQISKAQRFRSMTKLTQIINHEFDSNFDLNDIMNPTLSFLRKLLLAFVSKLGAAEGERNKAIMSQNVQRNEVKYQKQVLKRWLNTQYICPQLRVQKLVKYQPYRLKIQMKKDIFKRNIGYELSSVPGNANAIIRVMTQKQNMEKKRREAEEGITRKGEEMERNVHKIVKNNIEEWQKSDNAVKKLKKQLQKADQVSKQEQSQKAKAAEMSVYQQEVSKIAQQQKKLKNVDQKKTEAKTSQSQSLEQDLNPLERIRRQTQNIQMQLENQLNQIINSISQLKQSIQKKQKMKQKLVDQIQICQQRTTTQRQLRGALKKQVEKQKIMLDTIQGDTDITKQVQELQKEVDYFQKQADKQISNLEKDIQNTKKEGQQKLQILKDLKIRLNKIETDYTKVCEQIQDKNQIKGKVKITKSGLSRLYYSKKISEMEVRWRQTQKQSKKILQNVAKIRQQIRRLQYTAQISQTQIQNHSNSFKLKSQAQNLSFKDMFNQCKRVFSRTIQCIQQINATKNEVQQFEMKVHTLAGKDYKENIKKIEVALDELKKELKEVSKK